MRNVVVIATVLATAAVADPSRDGPVTKLPISEGHDLRFDHLPLGVDPSHRRVTGIVQDDLGFLWIGTDDGLKRYDGYRVRDYRHDPKDPNSLPDSYIISLFKDRSGRLWVASGRYLDVYDPVTEKFTPFRADPRSADRFRARVGEVNQDHEGTIWLSTDKGLYEVDPAAGIRFQYRHDPAESTSLSSNVVRSTVETRDGSLWVATIAGVDSIDRKNHTVTRHARFDMAHSVSSRIIEDRAGVLWLAYSGGHGTGLATVDRTANSLTHYRLIPQGEKLSAGAETVHEDADGNLWIVSSQSGLFRLDPGRTHFVRYRNNPVDPKTIASDELTVLFEDREGSIWVGTYGDGADRFTRKPLPFRRYVHEPGNPDSLEKDAVNAVFRDSNGVLWIGCTRALVKVNPHTGKFEFFHSHGKPKPGELSSVYVSSIAEDPSGYLWFGTHHGGGLNRLDRKTGRFQVFRHDKSNPHSLSDDAVVSIYVDRAGVLWAGTEDGLNRYDAKTQSFDVYPPPTKPSTYRWISEDSHGVLWLSTGWNGVNRFDPASGKFTIYRHTDGPGSLSSDAVNAICVDHSGIVWVGTRAGLNRLDPATGVVTVYNPGQSTISMESILEDPRGDLWLGTENGLVLFDPRAKTFRHYYVSDGLAANELGFYAAWKSPRGEMYFGSYGGLTIFDPAQIVDDSHVPPVRLTDLQIFGRPVAIGANSPLRQPISLTKSLRFSHAQNTFSLEFSALSYTNPARNRYRYRLEPLEREWNEVDSRRSVTYIGIPAGDYVFRVLASNSRGVWNEAGVQLAISVRPPWWGSWWFRTALVGIVLFSAWALLQLRLRQQAHEFNLRLEERIDERTRIARELHDTLLQSFQALAIMFQAARNTFASRPAEALKLLDQALDQTSKAIAEGREAIQGMRSSTSTSNELAKAIRAAGEEYVSEGSPVFRVVVEGPVSDVHPITRDEIYRIACEAIRNAFRHAEAKVIEAEVAYGDGLRVRIRDDGKGIDPAILKEGRMGHYGIAGMRERAARIGGTLRVWSAPGAGAEIELSVPGSMLFETSRRRGLRTLFRRKHRGTPPE